jgi:hypothetical protein
MEIKEIKRRMKSVHGREETLSADIHTLAVGILVHAAEHGDVSKAGELVAGFKTKTLRESLIVWFKTYSPILINTTTFHATQAKPNMASFKPYDVEGGTANPYYEQSSASNAAQLVGPADILGAMYAKLNLMEKANEEGRFVGDYAATRSALLRAIQASNVTDIEELREQTKNLKQAAKRAPVEAVQVAA